MKSYLYAKCTIFLLAALPMLVLGQSATQNYIRTRVPRVALQPGQVDAAATDKTKVQTTVQYVDGLGRPLQTVQQQGSATGNDVVQPVAYDQLGRETTKYLPYTQVPGTTPAAYRTDAFTAQPAFYQATGAGYSANANPYALSIIEPSPLNRVVEQGAPGAAWQPVAGSTAGHTTKVMYKSNDASSLTNGSGYWAKQYGVTIDAGTGNRTLTDQGSFAQNQLYVTVTVDENWTAGKLGTMEEYKDLEGHIVLKRTFNYNKATSINETLSTYYVYDDLGNLSFVLPPMANADAGLPAAAALNSLCYQYNYDERNRLTQKKLPGKAVEYTVYNQLDQPVLTQDGQQRLNNQWTVTKYDALGRVIITGLFNAGSAIPLATLQQNIYGAAQYDARDYSGNASAYPTGYIISSYPAINTQLSINYYDDYAAMPGMPGGYTAPAGTSQKTRGLLTASKTAVLNDVAANPQAMLWQVHYYDEEARLLAAYSQHYLGGLASLSANNYDALTSSYDFTGQLTAATRQHYKNNAGSAALQVTVNNTYSYDHTGRKLQTLESINGATPVLLVQNVYNELGQLWQKQLHGTNYVSGPPYSLTLGAADAVTGGSKAFTAAHSITMGTGFSVAAGATATFNVGSFLQTNTYAYNERGWLTSASAPLFAMQLTYNASASAGPFNGNISAQNWGTPGTLDKGFTYTYDNLNRLTDGSSTGNVNISETGLAYDLNGNLQALTRSGQYAGQLAYAYSGNQLSSVTKGGAAFRSYPGYDQNGNAATDGQGNAVTYNLLSQVQTISSKSLTYTYDAAGAKLRKVAGSAVTEYLSGIQWDNSANTSAAPVINFIQTEEGRAVRNTDNTYTYQYDLSDHLGNARLTFNQNPASLQAQALQADNYYPFGLRASATAGSNHYLYNHKELQDETGFYDYGARQYDPLIGRWLGFDPMAEAGRRHSPYEYGMNNPIRMVDPDGMWARVPLPAGASAPDFDGDPGSHTSGDEAEDAKKQQVGADGLTADQWVASSRPDADPGLADGFRQDNNAQERDGDKNGKNSTQDQGNIKDNIVRIAKEYNSSTAWAWQKRKENFPARCNKCNLYVYDVLKKAGVNPGLPHGHGQYPPTAADWANPSFKIPGWIVLTSKQMPMPGDIVAVHENYSDATGHVGIIIGPHLTSSFSSKTQSVVENDWGFRSDNGGIVFFRRYVGH